MKLRAKIWIEAEGGHVFGKGRAALLDAVEREGSIQAAARRAGVSYRRAWSLLKASEDRWGRSLVETTRGGAGGGGARLTEAGRILLQAYRRIEPRILGILEEGQRELDGTAL